MKVARPHSPWIQFDSIYHNALRRDVHIGHFLGNDFNNDCYFMFFWHLWFTYGQIPYQLCWAHTPFQGKPGVCQNNGHHHKKLSQKNPAECNSQLCCWRSSHGKQECSRSVLSHNASRLPNSKHKAKKIATIRDVVKCKIWWIATTTTKPQRRKMGVLFINDVFSTIGNHSLLPLPPSLGYIKILFRVLVAYIIVNTKGSGVQPPLLNLFDSGFPWMPPCSWQVALLNETVNHPRHFVTLRHCELPHHPLSNPGSQQVVTRVVTCTKVWQPPHAVATPHLRLTPKGWVG